MSRRFLLDENLPRRAAELLAHLGFPVLGVGLVDDLPRGTPDEQIAHWCAANDVVWITVDRDARKDPIVSAAVVAAGTSVLLLPGKGMSLRGYLLLLVRGFEHWGWARLVEESKRPYRARVARNGKLAPFSCARRLGGAELKARTPGRLHRPSRIPLEAVLVMEAVRRVRGDPQDDSHPRGARS